jgi:hypothetical protein
MIKTSTEASGAASGLLSNLPAFMSGVALSVGSGEAVDELVNSSNYPNQAWADQSFILVVFNCRSHLELV